MIWREIDSAPPGWLLLWTDDGWRLGFHMTSEDRWHIEGEKEATPTHWQHLPGPPE